MNKISNLPPEILNLPLEVRAEMAMKAAVEEVVEERIRDGRPLYIWRDGKVVAVPAEELRLEKEEQLRKELEAQDEKTTLPRKV
ncbi:MAG TPA: hypothetical protein VHA33_14030 [Candidatus Angelobacter sp.]|jgi:uncharacterized protein YacL (UPF0231 family)|nr:hypothetical protein [Candidatus Angelobacter sp.]